MNECGSECGICCQTELCNVTRSWLERSREFCGACLQFGGNSGIFMHYAACVYVSVFSVSPCCQKPAWCVTAVCVVLSVERRVYFVSETANSAAYDECLLQCIIITFSSITYSFIITTLTTVLLVLNVVDGLPVFWVVSSCTVCECLVL